MQIYPKANYFGGRNQMLAFKVFFDGNLNIADAKEMPINYSGLF